MNVKQIIKAHLVSSLVVGMLIGFLVLISSDSKPVNSLPALAMGIILSFIAYGGPVIAGLIVLWLIKKKLLWVSLKPYLVTYYVLVVLFLVQLWTTSNEVDSGFALLGFPWLPIPALLVCIFYGFAMSRLRK